MKTDPKLEAVARDLTDRDDFLITSHLNPDGDSLGAQLALAGILASLGKTCRIVNHNRCSDTYGFLPELERIEIIEPNAHYDFKTAVVLDIGEWERMGATALLVKPERHYIINIDHHQSNSGFGNRALVDTESCSTAMIIYKLSCRLGVAITPDRAAQLYTGILTDTGGFRFSNTSSEVLRVCAELVDRGADPTFIIHKVYFEKPLLAVKVREAVLSTLEFTADNRVVSVCLDQNAMARLEGYAEKDIVANTEGIIDYIRAIRGVDIALFFREESDGVKISLRSNSDIYNMNDLARKFGGGGHAQAAGIFTQEPLDQVRPRILEQVRALLK